uniref:Uncharacterized protein n=1 Tax=Physcomitrium patens TaxID=3218 RepID=A0A2K1JDK6_PHYPA|nr:hypothetical protein PHYPA_019888 [Physcomitrium patens]
MGFEEQDTKLQSEIGELYRQQLLKNGPPHNALFCEESLSPLSTTSNEMCVYVEDSELSLMNSTPPKKIAYAKATTAAVETTRLEGREMCEILGQSITEVSD